MLEKSSVWQVVKWKKYFNYNLNYIPYTLSFFRTSNATRDKIPGKRSRRDFQVRH